jgi:hypothetical protein
MGSSAEKASASKKHDLQGMRSLVNLNSSENRHLKIFDTKVLGETNILRQLECSFTVGLSFLEGVSGATKRGVVAMSSMFQGSITPQQGNRRASPQHLKIEKHKAVRFVYFYFV